MYLLNLKNYDAIYTTSRNVAGQNLLYIVFRKGTFCLGWGGFKTKEELQKHLKKVTKCAQSSKPFFVFPDIPCVSIKPFNNDRRD